MRRPLHWFLVSSALSLSSWSLFATATPENLTSNDSYDGSKTPPDPETFTARETSNEGGTTYTLTGDVFFKNITKAVSPVTTGSEPAEEEETEEPTTEPTASAEKSCFSNTAGPLTFTGNNHSLTFENISLTNEGASVSNKIATTTNPPDTTTTTATALSFEGFSSLSFTNAPAKVAETTTTEGETTVAEGEEETAEGETTPPTANGAIFVTNSTGGDAKFSGNTSVTFKSNSNVKSGGAISADTLEITGTTETLTFEDNSAKTGGAVCVSGDKILLSQNGYVLFSGNKAGVTPVASTPSETTEAATEPSDTSSGESEEGAVSALLEGKQGLPNWKITASASGSGDVSAAGSSATVTSAESTTTTAPEGSGGALCTYKTATASNSTETPGTEGTETPQTGIVLSKNEDVIFEGNTATASGGAIYTTTLQASETKNSLIFEVNTAKTGGAICVTEGSVSLVDNVSVSFRGNKAEVAATTAPETSATASADSTSVSPTAPTETVSSIITTHTEKQKKLPNWSIKAEEVTTPTTTSGDTTPTTTNFDGCGGAICCYVADTTTDPAQPGVTLSGNTSMLFDGNSATANGGAIYATTVTATENGTVTFSNSSATGLGGAIYTDVLDINKTTTKLLFNTNSSKTGGAVYIGGGKLSLTENTSVVFSGNKAKAPETNTESTPSDSDSTTSSTEPAAPSPEGSVTSLVFGGKQKSLPDWSIKAEEGTTTTAPEETTPTTTNLDGCGGAICCHTATTSTTTTETTTTTPTTNGVTLTQNPDVTFDLNSATADGGAIYATTVTATGNGNITFSNNTAGGLGGAIYTDTLDINTTTTKVTFENNSAEAGGAAYVAQGKASLTNNASVVFSGNKATFKATTAPVTEESAESPDSTTSEPGTPSSSEGSKSNETASVIATGNRKTTLPDWRIKAEGEVATSSVDTTTTTTSDDSEGTSETVTTTTTENAVTETAATTLDGCGGAICCSITDTTINPAQPGVSLSGNTSIIFDGNSATASGGAIYGSKITVTENGAVTFSENTAKTGGAVHVAGGDLSLSNNTSITFRGNSAVSATTPVTETNAEIPSETPSNSTESPNTPTENTAASSIQAFEKRQTQRPNWSISATGGEVTTPSVDTTTTTTSDDSEGTSETVTTTTTENAVTETAATTLDGCGGAICCYVAKTTTSDTNPAQPGVTLSGNTSLIFDGNSATVSGGAIYGAKVSATGNQTVTFSNNTATTSGGAIHAKTLIISAAGTTTFSNNSSAQGGAINIEAGGTLTLEAISGDIIFEGNTTKSTDGTVVPNSIHLGDGATMIMRANSGHTIYFYDPITIDKTTDTTTGETAPKIIINAPVPATPASESPVINSGPLFDIPGFPRLPRMSTTGGTTTTPTGTVVFSGEKLTEELAKNPAGATSTINQDVELQNGSLEIKDGATIAVKSLTQNSDSMIIMDAGTTLKTTSTAEGNTDGALTITNLAVNIDSITPTSKPITIAVNSTSGKLALSGDLNYYSESGSYENPALGHDFSIPLFNFAGEGTINTDGFSMTPAGDLPTSSGYQGQWVLKPVTADGKTVFIATWEAAGYTPLPERNAFLLPNSLWNITRDALAIQEIIATTINNETSNSIWAAGLSNFFHRSSKKSVGSGFRYISGGYVFGGNIEIPSGNSMGIALAQLFGKAKDYSISDVKSRVYAGTLYAQHSQPITIPDFMRNHPLSRIIPQLPKEVPSIMKAQLTYARANNDMKTKYESATQGESKWHDHCLALEASNYMPVRANNRYINTYSPFVKVQLVYANQTSCQEVAEAAYVRDFSTSHLINLSVPMGIVLEKHSENSPHSFDLTLTYNMDLYRDKPSLLVSMPATGVSWTAFATNLARQGLQAQAASHHKLGKHFEVCTHGGCELRSSSRSYNADCGGKYFF